jgi:hypothetical protein
MTRIRHTHEAPRRPGQTFELVNFTEAGEWVARDDDNHVLLLDDDWVEVRCDRCGQWSRGCAPVADGWACDANCERPV